MWGIGAFSCVENEKSAFEKIIVDETFVDSVSAGAYSVSVDTLVKYNITQTFHYFDDSTNIMITRDSLNRIINWWHRDTKRRTIAGAEVYPTTGQIMGKLNYINNKIEGETVFYYEDGRIRSIGYRKSGNDIGVWENYDSDGNLISLVQSDENGVRKTTKVK